MFYKILGLAILLISCSTEKRCNRVVAKAERLQCLTFKNDTFIIHDTLNGWQYDTIFTGINQIDTFIKEINGTKIKTVVNWRDRIIKQTGKTDTIFKTRLIIKEAPQKLQPKKKYSTIERAAIYLLILLVILQIIRWFK